MKIMKTTDNNLGKFSIADATDCLNITEIANKNLEELTKEHPNLLIFPSKLGGHEDDIHKEHLFSLDDVK